MPFFQNPFSEDFEGNWLLADRQHIPKFVVKANAGRGREHVISHDAGPHNLSGNDSDSHASKYLNICFCLHNNKNWATITVDISVGAASTSAVTNREIASALNVNSLFAERFTAKLHDNQVMIVQKKPTTDFKFYIVNGQAEEKLKFNSMAGVAELPTYFSRHTLTNRFNFADSVGMLIELNNSLNVDNYIIDNAVDFNNVSLGYDHSTIKEDWQLLQGKSGLFQFTKGPSSSSISSTTTTIIYHAGAKAGDLAKKIVIQKDSGGNIVNQFEIPYTLDSGDLITPP